MEKQQQNTERHIISSLVYSLDGTVFEKSIDVIWSAKYIFGVVDKAVETGE